MVQTKKFSEFSIANLNDNTNLTVGLGSGVNNKSPKVVVWTTLGRPATPFNGLLGYNSDLSLYEYWDAPSSEWVQFKVSTSDLNWSTVTVASITASTNNGYVADRSSTPVNILLPDLFHVGDRVKVLQLGTAGWSVIANVGQQIIFGDVTTAVEGSISSTNTQGDNIELIGLVENTLWEVSYTFGNPIYI